MNIVMRQISELIPADYNPNYMNPQDREDLQKSLREFGFVEPVIVNLNPERLNTIVGGHHRIEEWAAMGYTEVPTVEVNLSLAKEKELNIRLNKNRGQFDKKKLNEFFEKLDLLDWGFDLKDLADLTDKPEKFNPAASQKDENYNISYQLIFSNEEEQEKWFAFIKRLKVQYPEMQTISERVIAFIDGQK